MVSFWIGFFIGGIGTFWTIRHFRIRTWSYPKSYKRKWKK